MDDETPGYWMEKLSSACTHAQVDTASLGIINNTRVTAVRYCNPALPQDFAGTRSPAFCVAKLVTSTLVCLLVSQGKLRFEDEIDEILPASDSSLAALHGITVAHLLSHTHGLHGTGLLVAPVYADGFIDREQVFATLGQGARIFIPGKFYSYGAVGYVLLGLVIEHVMQLTFGHVLDTEILARIGNAIADSPQAISCISDLPICPSSGNGLNLSLSELLGFANNFLFSSGRSLNLPGRFIEEIFTTRKLMPGWSPTIAGICYGWKAFANTWHGHDGMDSHNQMYIRINLATKTAICLIAHSATRNPGALTSLLFKHDYPELSRGMTKQPAILADVMPDSGATIIGTFGDSRTSFTISLINNRLMVTIASTNNCDAAIPHHCYLYRAEGNLFFLAKPWHFITFLQLVTDGSTTRYLWDHTQLWPELAK